MQPCRQGTTVICKGKIVSFSPTRCAERLRGIPCRSYVIVDTNFVALLNHFFTRRVNEKAKLTRSVDVLVSTTKTSRGSVSFAENAAVIADQVDAEDSSVFEFQGERKTDPISGIAGRIKIDRTFDAVQTGNRQAGVVDKTLIACDRV